MSQGDLANAADVSKGAIESIEYARKVPRLDTLLKVARALRTTVVELLPESHDGLR